MRKGYYNTEWCSFAVVLDATSSCTGHGVLATLHDCRIYYILDDHILTYMVGDCKRKFGELSDVDGGLFVFMIDLLRDYG